MRTDIGSNIARIKGRLFFLTIVALGLTLALAPQAKAQLLVSPITFTGGTANGSVSAFNGWEMGYSFTANTTITVADLSLYVGTGNANSITPVGIWSNSTQTLLASAEIGTGTSVPTLDGFAYAAITPITLTAGQTYTVAAWYQNNGGSSTQQNVAFGVTNATFDPSVTFLNNEDVLLGSTGNLTFPTGHFGANDGLFGGSFIEETQGAVPEPSTWACMLAGLGLLAMFTQRKRGSHNC